jgi:hypothetical protein
MAVALAIAAMVKYFLISCDTDVATARRADFTLRVVTFKIWTEFRDQIPYNYS